MKKGKTSFQAISVGWRTRLVLHLQMSMLLYSAFRFLFAYQSALATDAVGANLLYGAMAEYLVAGLVICIGSVCLVDLIEREATKRP